MKFEVFLLLCCTCAAHRSAGGGQVRTASASDFATLASVAERRSVSDESPDVSKDYNDETEVRVPVPEAVAGKEKLSVSMEASVATVWCLMMASIPFILAMYSEHEISSIIYVEGALLMMWLVGGIAAFTQVILFQSAHFDGHRSLTMVESTYLLTQILTTIGYGDITPAYPRGQVVIGLYIVLSVVLVGNMFSQVVEVLQKRVVASREAEPMDITMMDSPSDVRARLELSESSNQNESKAADTPTGFDWVEPRELDHASLVKAFAVYVCIATVGIVFFHQYPGEEKTWLQAIYMSLVTLSTVGFGVFTASTEVGKAFASFWMLIGVAALGNFVNTCIEWSLQKKMADSYSPEKEHISWVEMINRMDINKDGSIDAAEFLRFALVHAGHCSDEQIERVQQFFRRMHPDKNGRVPIEKFQKLGSPELGETTPPTTATSA